MWASYPHAGESSSPLDDNNTNLKDGFPLRRVRLLVSSREDVQSGLRDLELCYTEPELTSESHLASPGRHADVCAGNYRW